MTPKEYWHRRAQDWPTAAQNARGVPNRKLSAKEEQKIKKMVHDVVENYYKRHAKKN